MIRIADCNFRLLHSGRNNPKTIYDRIYMGNLCANFPFEPYFFRRYAMTQGLRSLRCLHSGGHHIFFIFSVDGDTSTGFRIGVVPSVAQFLPFLAHQVPSVAPLFFINCTWLIFGKGCVGIYSGDAPLLPYSYLSVPERDRDTGVHNVLTHLPTARGWTLHLFISRLLPGLNS